MVLPLQVTFRNIPPSDAIESAIRARAARLDRVHPHITSCRVLVEAQSRRHVHGDVYAVRIDVTVPGAELAVGRAHDRHHADEDVYVAIRDAFDEMRRRLQDHKQIRRGAVKTHAPLTLGRVARLDRSQGSGFIETEDGHDLYFDRDAVSPEVFERLEVGTPVRFGEELGGRGWRVKTVSLAD